MQDTEIIIAVSFNEHGVPTMIYTEEQGSNGKYMHDAWEIVRTRKRPREWFIDGTGTTGACLEPNAPINFYEFWLYTDTPITSIWIAPGRTFCVSTTHPSQDAPTEEALRKAAKLEKLPSKYTIERLRDIIKNALEGAFTYCDTCKDFESCMSTRHSKHIKVLFP